MVVSKMHGPYTKFLIFVSSSLRDLRDERKAIIEQILMAGHIPAGMELFVASNAEDRKVIDRAIEQADVYVVLVGSRFGTPVDEQNDRRSYTQMEFEYAFDLRKPILAFLMEEDQFEAERNAIPARDKERLFEKELRQFREEAKKKANGDGQRFVSYFGDKLDGVGGLKATFHAALDNLIDEPEVDMPGWVPGTESERFRLPKEIDDNEFIRNIVMQLSTYDVFSARCAQNALLKETMASYFWDQYEARITNLGIRRLFFESGSTIAYLSTEFKNRLSRPAGRKRIGEWKIRTNNISTYLDFVLSTTLRTTLVPYGPPERKYGATFGEITELPEAAFPTENKPLTREEEDAVHTIINVLKSPEEPSVFLMTSSALELSENSDFRGPHVGSYYNKLFKRAILGTQEPTVLFLDESKVPAEFRIGYCHAVCGPGMKFEEICRSLPLAFCVGCASCEGRNTIMGQLKQLGFGYVEPAREYKGCWPLIAKNQPFKERIE